MVEVNCETDFVAKNEDFVQFSAEVANELADPAIDLETRRTEQVAKIGENIRISRFDILEPQGGGLVESYVHTGSKVAVLISLISEGPESINNESINHMAKDLCMHIAATSPVSVCPVKMCQKI